jgi:uncharacterized protein (TIGR02266 family)
MNKMPTLADPNPSGRREERAPSLLVVNFRLPGKEAFIERYAANISRGGIFLVSRELHPVGTELCFEVRTAEGASAFNAKGVVCWSRNADAAKQLPPGLGIQFTEIDDENRAVVERMVTTAEQAARVPGVSGTAAVPALIPADAAVKSWLESLETQPAPRHSKALLWVGLFMGIAVPTGLLAGWVLRGWSGEQDAMGTGGVVAVAPPSPVAVSSPDSVAKQPRAAPAENPREIVLEGTPAAMAEAETEAGQETSELSEDRQLREISSASEPKRTRPAKPGDDARSSRGTKGTPATMAEGQGRDGKKMDLSSMPNQAVPAVPVLKAPSTNPEKDVRDAIEPRLLMIQSCYERLLKTDAELTARITLEIVLAADERMNTVSIISNSSQDSRVARCVRRAFTDMEFPRVREDVTILIPFKLTPKH